MKKTIRFDVSLKSEIPYSRQLYGIFSFTDMTKIFGKGNSVSHCPARSAPFGFSKKSPRLRFASGSIFPKNLAGQDTELMEAKNFNHVRKGQKII